MNQTRRQALTMQVSRLQQRLEDGWGRIDEAEIAGEDATAERYETVWLRLLENYERACDELERRRR